MDSKLREFERRLEGSDIREFTLEQLKQYVDTRLATEGYPTTHLRLAKVHEMHAVQSGLVAFRNLFLIDKKNITDLGPTLDTYIHSYRFHASQVIDGEIITTNDPRSDTFRRILGIKERGRLVELATIGIEMLALIPGGKLANILVDDKWLEKSYGAPGTYLNDNPEGSFYKVGSALSQIRNGETVHREWAELTLTQVSR